MNSSLQTVSAVIPTRAVPDFYRWVANAHEAHALATEISPQTGPGLDSPIDGAGVSDGLTLFAEADPDLVRAWWEKLSDTAREALALMATNADERFNGTELSKECENLAGPSGAAGTFAWPSRYAKKMGFEAPWHWDGEMGAYYMPARTASILLAAIDPTNR